MKKRVDKLAPKLDHYLFWVLGMLNMYQPDNYKWTGFRNDRVFTFWGPDKKKPVVVVAGLPWGSLYEVYLDGSLVNTLFGPGCSNDVQIFLDAMWREGNIV